MMPVLYRMGFADLRRHPIQTVLAIVGVAIAVAVVVAVDLANHSAREAMRLSLESVAGRATHQVVGGPDGVDEQLYTQLRTTLGLQQAAPVLEGGVQLPEPQRRAFTLLGLDAFAEGPFQRPIGSGDTLGDAFNTLFLRDDAVALGEFEAARLGLAVGDTFTMLAAGREHALELAAVVSDPDDQARGLIVADIAATQHLLQRQGKLTRIDLILEPHQEAEVEALLAQNEARLVLAGASATAVVEMSRAFHTNLTALSLLAVVVGAFLVFNTLAFIAVRRRATIGVLRAMGVKRQEIFKQVLGDALVIGALGTLIGLGLGYLLAQGLVGLVLQTVGDLYLTQTAGQLLLSPFSVAAGITVGLGGSVLAAIMPSMEAAGTPPRAALSRAHLETRARGLAKKSAGLGVGALLLSAVILVLSEGLVAAFLGLFVLIMGAALLTPLVVLLVGALLRPLTRGRPIAALIVEGAVASLSRTGVAVAALTVAVAAVIGVAVMITSFRVSVVDWLEGSLAADFYISAPQQGLTDALADSLAALPAVDFVSRSRWVDLATDQGPVELWALELPDGELPAVDIRQGDPAAALAAFAEDSAVLVSEAFASRRDLAPGDSLELPVGAKMQAFSVAGVHRDYASPGGVVLMRRALYQSLYADDALSGIGVHLPEQTDRATAMEMLEQQVSAIPGVRVVDNAAIFAQSLAIFDRTFAITEVLRWLAGLVAFVGVLGALMALHLDRTREFAVLRAIGLSRSGLGWVVSGQSGLLGLVAGLCAIPLGVALAWLLVFVINRRAFGWTMGFDLHALPLLEGVALAVLAALIAAIQPAWRAARLSVAMLLLAAAGVGHAQNMAEVMGPDIDTDRFARVTGPAPLVFPDDHGAHPDYRTEWWYFVGNLADEQGQEFGFQLTFFRSALDPEPPARSSDWATRQAWMGHFAITHITDASHRAVERYQRGALGLAGAQVRPVRIWMDNWQALSLTEETLFPLQLSAQDEQTEIGLDLYLEALKPHVLQGDEGYSQKGEDPGNASRYYSFTRLGAAGEIRFADQTYQVSGSAWLDREWSTSALDSNQEGWDWFSLQLEDNREVMVYRLRRTDGSTAPQSAGIVVAPDGQSTVLGAADFTLTPLRYWQSRETGSSYPVSWSLVIPEHDLELAIDARVDAQEMPTTIRYWEGAVGVEGMASGVGYMELTGY